jgi:hypothetical protein
MSQIGTSGDSIRPSVGGRVILPDTQRSGRDDAGQNKAAKRISDNVTPPVPTVGSQPKPGAVNSRDRGAPEADGTDQALRQSATAAAVRVATEEAAAAARSSGYTLHAMPWEVGDYQSKRAITLYETNQELPVSVGQAIEMLPRINERI